MGKRYFAKFRFDTALDKLATLVRFSVLPSDGPRYFIMGDETKRQSRCFELIETVFMLQTFPMHFLQWKFRFPIKTSPTIAPIGPIDNKATFVQTMACLRTSDKLNLFSVDSLTWMRHMSSINQVCSTEERIIMEWTTMIYNHMVLSIVFIHYIQIKTKLILTLRAFHKPLLKLGHAWVMISCMLVHTRI